MFFKRDLESTIILLKPAMFQEFELIKISMWYVKVLNKFQLDQDYRNNSEYIYSQGK